MCVCEGGGLENTKKRKEKWVDGGVGGGWKEQLICCWCLLDVGCKRSHLTRNRTVLLLVLSLLGFFFFFCLLLSILSLHFWVSFSAPLGPEPKVLPLPRPLVARNIDEKLGKTR